MHTIKQLHIDRWIFTEAVKLSLDVRKKFWIHHRIQWNVLYMYVGDYFKFVQYWKKEIKTTECRQSVTSEINSNQTMWVMSEWKFSTHNECEWHWFCTGSWWWFALIYSSYKSQLWLSAKSTSEKSTQFKLVVHAKILQLCPFIYNEW